MEWDGVDSLVLLSVLWEADDSIVSAARSLDLDWDRKCKSVTCSADTRVLF